MKEKLKAKRIITFIIVMMMLVTSLPVSVLAEGETKLEPIRYLNENVENLPVNVYKPDLSKGKTSGDYIKDPEMAELYTARRDFKVRRGEEFVINYEPYIATVGEDATDEEKAKINKTIPKPEFDGYTSPTPDQRTIEITYNKIKSLAQKGHKDGAEFKGTKDYQYTPKRNKIKVKHVFQSLDDKSIYGRMDGSTKDIETEEWGETGSSITITPLEQIKRPGYVPEENEIITQVPEENVNDIEIEYRYNRARYLVKFDSNGGSDVHSLNIFYGKTIPYNDEEPKKEGCGFVGWITDTDITYGPENDRKTISAGTLITNKDEVEFTNANGTKEKVNVKDIYDPKKTLKINNDIKTNGFVNAMPASDIVFKAYWKEKPTADYTIQYWTEKADYDDKDTNLTLRDKYDFIGSYVVKDAGTGSQPSLKDIAEDNRGANKGNITFPDLNGGRLGKAQNDKNEFARYYFLNEPLTEDANKVPDPDKPANKVQKKVLATGETVYNVYYNRRVYTLYFTSINDYNDEWAYWPIITRNGQVLGKEGAPYKVDVRFNQSLDKIWPKDEEVSGLPKGDSTNPTGDDGLIGWTINNNVPFLIFRDTPPYRLSAEDFIDPEDVMGTGEDQGHGHADKIPIGKNKEKDRGEYEISLGASYIDTAIAYHIDIIKDDFEGKEQIDYDMSYWKSDTNTYDYEFILPHLQGFTLKKEKRPAQLIGKIKVGDVEKTFDKLNEERKAITPFRSDADKINYIDHFPWSKKLFDGTNAYNYANYTRNKYKLKLNDDPKKIKNDSDYIDGKDRFDVFYEMPLKNLDLDTKYKPQRPAWVPNDWEFKGWATDPAGENLLKDGKETKLHYDQFLFAKWGEPDKKYTVKFDLNGGNTNYSIEAGDIATHKAGESIETSLGEKKYVLPVKKVDENNGSVKVFEVENRMNIREPKYNSYSLKPRRDGYDFLGWERVRFINNDPTQGKDDSYKNKYKTEELYAFGNEITSDVYLRAIWVPNHLVNINAYHHFLDLDYNEYEAGNEELIKLGENKSPYVQPLAKKRENKFMAAVASKQGENWYLIPQVEWESLKNMKHVQGSKDYKTYIEDHKDADGHYKRKNTYNQHGIVEPEFLDDKSKNPKFDSNDFHFYYRRFRQTKYRVNYIDVRGQEEIDKTIKDTTLNKDEKENKIDELVEKYGIIASENIVNGKSDYDARNYRRIPGWKLESKRQQQLFFDLDEQGKLNGINGTGLDEVFFYYRDVRVIDVPENDPVPDGYVRVTFKADKGGSFGNYKNGNPIKELHYNVIKGLKSDLLPVPELLKDGETADTNKYYITPENGKKFIKWDDKPLLNPNTIIENETKDYYVFTAKFEWSGLSAKGLVKTEAFIDPNDTWTNDFAPTIEQLKAQLVWREKDQVKDLPAGTVIKFYDEKGNELKTDEDVFKLVNEKKAADKDELVRTVNIKAKVTFPDKKDPQELDIPITIYKNVYEALNKAGDKPLFLKEAEAKEAKDGGLKDVTGNYVKVTVQPTNKPSNKDAKIYYVNPKAWVEIPEITLTEDEKKELGFTHWSADKDAQNENGVYDFTKRHMFTEDTVISPGFTNDVVEQTDPNTKPPVPDSYVKVIVKTTDKATTEFTKTFWVNPTKEVTIPVTNPTGKTIEKTETEQAKAYTFKDWKSDEDTSRTWTSGIKGKFTKATTITAEYTEVQNIIPYDPVENPTTRPNGYVRVTFVAEKGLKLNNVKHYYVKKNAGIKLGNTELVKPEVKAETGYEFVKWDQDDATEITETDIVVTAKARELDSFIPADGNTKPDGYVTVTFVAEANGSLKGVKQYYVNPTKYVAFNPPEAIGNTGYEFASWSQNSAQNTNYKEDTIITAKFTQIGAVSLVEKPGYVKVDFVITDEGGSILNGQTRTYYVDPNRAVTLNAPVTSADVGYEFASWSPDPAAESKYTNPTIIEGTFKKLADIIPATEDQGKTNTKPDGYVTLTFEKGNGGKTITGQTVYYVNPEANPAKTLVEITKPNVTPDTGYTFEKWDTEDSFPIKADKTVTAKYKELDPVIVPGPGVTKPEGYATVTFDTTSKGLIEGTNNTEKIVYVNPKKPVVLKDHEPKVKPTTNNVFARWDVNLEKETFFKDGDRITAQYYDKNNISVTEIPGFVKVVFDKGDHGKLSGTQTYWVKPGVNVTVPAPTVNPSTGYEFNNWNHSLTVNLAANSGTYIIKAEYKSLEDIIEGDKIRPNGYVKVEFVSDGNGKLIGTTSYYVNPTKPVDLTSKAEAIFKNPNVGYTEIGGNWSNDKNKNLNDTFSEDASFKYNFKELKDVDRTNHPGYVKVQFIAGENGQIDGGNKTYYVNPNKNIMVGSNDLPIPETSANKNYMFDKWFTGIDKKYPVTSDRTYIAQFKLSKVTLTYKATDATSGNVPAALTYDIGTEITLAGGNDLKKDNYVLTGWKIGDETYKPGEKFTINDNTTAVAVWDTDYHNVDFNTDGGTYIEPKKIKHNETIGSVTPPTKDGYTFTGWQVDGQDFDPTKSKVEKDITLVAKYVPNVVEQKDPNTKPEVPDDFVKVIVKTTEDGIEKATEDTKFEKTFWVKKDTQVTIPVNPPTGDFVKDASGNNVTDAAGNKIVWKFKEWKSKEADPRTWKDTIEAKFVEETTIEAKYEKTIPDPTVEASIVETYVGRQPELADYKGALKASLGNVGIDFDTNVKSIKVTTEPNVDQAGMSEAKVKVEFKNGQVKEVTVPVKVYDNIYPGDTNGNKTSETPDNYVKVTVNPKAYDEDDQKIKVYYVNPLAKVSIPEILIKEADKEEYGFKKWTTNNKEINSSNNDEIYDFAKDYKFTTDTEIYAFYEKNGEPEIKIDFETKEIVKNIGDKVSVKEYEDALIVPKDPEGKGIAEIKGINIFEEPDTSKEGYTTAKIQVVYDDGKSQELIVLVKVLPDVVEQTDPDKKPDVPNDFVKVIIKTTEKVVDNGVEIEEERATNETAFERTFWVNPTKHITIDVTNPTGIKDITDNRTWNFDYWKVDTDDGAEYRTIITDQFTKDTTILAKYTKDEVQKPSVKDIITEEGVQPNKKDYLDKLEAPDGKSINDIKIIKEPNVSRPGISTATIEVEYDDGTKALVDVKVFVQRKNELRPSEPQIIYRDRIVEKEKIVEKIVKIKDNERLKELRYMQGFNGKFRPYDGLRRSEAAQILANALKADGYAYDPYYPISYTDIGETWYTEAVRIVSQAGVFQGYSDGTFKPEGKITRAEWVATLRRFQHLKAISGNTMGLRLGHWATEEIEAAYREGWLNIYTNGIAKFDADMPITRQEVAAVSNKAFERLVDKEYIDKNDDALINYVDINPMMPLYEDILCASNSFLHDNDYYLAHNIRKNINEFNINISKYKIYQDKFQRVFEK